MFGIFLACVCQVTTRTRQGVFLTAVLLASSCFLFAQADFPASTAEEIQQSYQKLLDLGLASFVDGEYAKAAEFFRHAIKVKPNDDTAQKALKSVEKKLSKRSDEATEISKTKVQKAKEYYRNKQYLVAIMTLKSVLEKSAGVPGAIKLMNKIFAEIEGLAKKEAENSYRQLTYKGMTAYIEEKYEDSIAFWEKALALNPHDQLLSLAVEQAKSYLRRASSPTQMAQAELEEFFAVSSSAPASSTPSSLQPIETTTAQSGSRIIGPLPALGFSDTKGFLSPSDSPGRVLTINASTKTVAKGTEIVQGSERPAESELDRMSSVATSKAEVDHGSVATLETGQVKGKEDGQTFRARASAERDPPEILEANALLSRKEHQRSIELLKKFLRSNPEHRKAQELLINVLTSQKEVATKRYNEGLLAYAQGDFSKAFVSWQEVLRVYPEHPNARKVLLRAFFQGR